MSDTRIVVKSHCSTMRLNSKGMLSDAFPAVIRVLDIAEGRPYGNANPSEQKTDLMPSTLAARRAEW